MVMMLVDDEERFLSTTSKLLNKKGYEPLTATSGQEALDKLAKEYVDVVILDVKMPGMDGVTALKEIKSRYPLVEVIMLTGHGTIDNAVEGMKTGAYDYLTKPCDLEELITKAEEAYERKRMMEEKIRMAQVRKAMASPREVVKETDGGK
ncbi:chemotaxis protein CheY [Desulfocarbo indianensis]|nr:chemotaxis protein CheY [Desulfocarbo indianensis]